MKFLPVEEQLSILRRGVVEIVPEDGLKKKLETSFETGRPLNIKLGVDPTAPDVHLGFTVVMRKLATFQKLGHQVVLIVGDYTATVGDPSGKSKTRPRISHDEVLKNAETYQEQFFRIVDREKTKVVFNGEWFRDLSFDRVTTLMSRITVAQMLEREDFQNRYRSGQPISLHEFLYPMMQAYDSVKIEADVEIGGTDQKFNVLRGRELQQTEGQEAQVGLFMPILIGTDGREKMSKSLGNYVGINEAPDLMFHKIYNIADDLLENWFRLLTDFPEEEIASMSNEFSTGTLNPVEAKTRLALDIVSQYYGKEVAVRAFDAEKAVHAGNAIPSDAKSADIASGEHPVLDLLVTLGAFQSKGEARRMILGGGVRLDGEKLLDPRLPVAVSGKEQVIQVGKRKFFRLNSLPQRHL